MGNVYLTPEAVLDVEYVPLFNFSNLGAWRKIFLALNWVSSISISLAMVSAPILALFGNTEEVAGISIWQIIILLLIVLLSLGYAYWLHRAVCGRILLQISILAGVQIIPMLNPVGLIILLAIRSTSKTEISKASET